MCGRMQYSTAWMYRLLQALTDRLKSWPLYILPHHLVSRFVYRLTRIESRLVPAAIRQFARLFNIDLQEATHPDPEHYKTFNQFFTRTLKDGAREISGSNRQFCSPVDGRVSQLGSISDGTLIQAKGRDYSVFDLLGGRESDISTFLNGTFATLYLSPRDYHRIHMPATGDLCAMHYIPGRLFSVAPHTVRVVPRLFARNERVVAIFDTDAGKVAMVLVGAINVAAIETVWAGLITPPTQRSIVYKDYEPSTHVLAKGQEMGRFNMGSTVILLLENGAFRSDLSSGDPISMGQLLGNF